MLLKYLVDGKGTGEVPRRIRKCLRALDGSRIGYKRRKSARSVLYVTCKGVWKILRQTSWKGTNMPGAVVLREECKEDKFNHRECLVARAFRNNFFLSNG